MAEGAGPLGRELRDLGIGLVFLAGLFGPCLRGHALAEYELRSFVITPGRALGEILAR